MDCTKKKKVMDKISSVLWWLVSVDINHGHNIKCTMEEKCHEQNL